MQGPRRKFPSTVYANIVDYTDGNGRSHLDHREGYSLCRNHGLPPTAMAPISRESPAEGEQVLYVVPVVEGAVLTEEPVSDHLRRPL